MTFSASEPESEGKADADSASARIQPPSEARAARGAPEPPLPSVPDHELLRCIGRGAYGAVWLARNVMGTLRAVKIVHREDFTRDRPFTREYEGLLHYEPISRSHPNLMQILHVGRRDSYFYYVTELADDAGQRGKEECRMQNAEGLSHAASTSGFGLRTSDLSSYVPRTLQEDLERRGRLPMRECVSLATALSSALKHLHNHGLVHRDVKPSNVILVHGVPKLADIGLVATVGDSRSIVGTEGYLPPEGPGNPQADLYSLGKLLYEVSTGLNRGEYPLLPKNLGALPDASGLLEFNEVLLKACAKDTTRRYHQAEELLADLALLERGDSVKRLRRLERHHALLKRIAVGALMVGLAVAAAWWQSSRAHQIATRHLARHHVDEGVRRMAGGDYLTALPWLVGALELEAGNSHLETVHRTRIASVLQRCPVPVAHFSAPDSKVVTADLSPDSTVVATAHNDGCVRLWDARSGRQIQQLPHDFPVAVCQFLPSGDRILTVTIRQEAQVWEVAKPKVAPLTFAQALSGDGTLYSVGLNEKLSRAFLSKGRHIFARFREPYMGPFSNLTLRLKLAGQKDGLWVKGEVRPTAPDSEPLFADGFLDTPKVEAFAAGSDNPAEPAWGHLCLFLENPSFADSPGASGEVIWDNLQLRRYRSSEPPPAWRILDNFSSGLLTNWLYSLLAEEGRSCQATNGQFVQSCTNLPTSHTPSGLVMYREPLEISPTHTLEVQVDLVSVRAPHPVVSLLLGHYVFDAFSAPDRPFIAHGRWLATTFWDAPIRIWDLEKARLGAVRDEKGNRFLELGAIGEVEDMDFSPDTNRIAVVWTPKRMITGTNFLRVWGFRTGSEFPLDKAVREGVNGARFSPDSRFLAVGRKDSLDLLRTTDWRLATNLARGTSFSHPRFSPRGSRLAAVRDELDIVVWDLGDLDEPPVTFAHQAPIRRIAFSPDGRYLAASINDMVHIWDVVQGKAFGPPLPGALGRFSLDGAQVLVIGGENGAWLWDLSRIEDDTLAVPMLRGVRLSAASADGTLTAEVVGQGIALKTLGGQSSLALPVPVPLRWVAFSPDDRCLITESSDGRAYVWEVRTRTLLQPPRPVRYDVLLEGHSLPNLPLEPRDQKTLSDLAALLAKQRPDGQGGMIPVYQTEQAWLFGELRRTYPADFEVDDPSRLRWHREQAQAAEAVMDWDAAVFHWERCLENKAESRAAETVRQRGEKQKAEIPLESRLTYARQVAEVLRQAMLVGDSKWSRILPRPPWASTEMLDLSKFYTLPLGEPMVSGHPSTSFRGLTGGVQTLGGTGFDVRGIIYLKLTNHLTITVDRACRRIHFLHAASQATFNREKTGSYEVTYASGRKVPVDLLNPNDAPPFTSDRFHEIAALSWTNKASGLHLSYAWSGGTPGPASRKELLYLARATWDLPTNRWGQIVQSIELRAGPAESAPLVLAITVE